MSLTMNLAQSLFSLLHLSQQMFKSSRKQLPMNFIYFNSCRVMVCENCSQASTIFFVCTFPWWFPIVRGNVLFRLSNVWRIICVPDCQTRDYIPCRYCVLKMTSFSHWISKTSFMILLPKRREKPLCYSHEINPLIILTSHFWIKHRPTCKMYFVQFPSILLLCPFILMLRNISNA